jgi:hypothetical protein
MSIPRWAGSAMVLLGLIGSLLLTGWMSARNLALKQAMQILQTHSEGDHSTFTVVRFLPYVDRDTGLLSAAEIRARVSNSTGEVEYTIPITLKTDGHAEYFRLKEGDTFNLAFNPKGGENWFPAAWDFLMPVNVENRTTYRGLSSGHVTLERSRGSRRTVRRTKPIQRTIIKYRCVEVCRRCLGLQQPSPHKLLQASSL